MKKSHKPKKHSSAKGKKKGKKGKGRKKGGLGSASKALVSGIADIGKPLLGNAIGLGMAALACKGLDKIEKLASDPADGKMKAFAKKAVKPTALILLGVTTKLLAKKAGVKGAPFVHSIGDGLNMGALITGVKAAKPELFSGFGSIGAAVSEEKVAEYYRENADELKKIAEENATRLKGLNDYSDESNDLGDTVVIPGTTLDLDGNGQIL